jgi:hypothetical protein
MEASPGPSSCWRAISITSEAGARPASLLSVQSLRGLLGRDAWEASFSQLVILPDRHCATGGGEGDNALLRRLRHHYQA